MFWYAQYVSSFHQFMQYGVWSWIMIINGLLTISLSFWYCYLWSSHFTFFTGFMHCCYFWLWFLRHRNCWEIPPFFSPFVWSACYLFVGGNGIFSRKRSEKFLMIWCLKFSGIMNFSGSIRNHSDQFLWYSVWIWIMVLIIANRLYLMVFWPTQVNQYVSYDGRNELHGV